MKLVYTFIHTWSVASIVPASFSIEILVPNTVIYVVAVELSDYVPQHRSEFNVTRQELIEVNAQVLHLEPQ